MRSMVLLLALAAGGGPAAAAGIGREPRPAADDKTLVGRSPETWLKVYSLPAYREHWTAEIVVRDAERDVPRIKAVFADLGASRPVSEGGDEPAGVLTYHSTQKSAARALARLRTLGRVSAPVVRPILEPVSLPEVQRKIKLLEADGVDEPGRLSTMPAVAELAGEVLDHLRTVEAALLKPDGAVLLRLTVKEGS